MLEEIDVVIIGAGAAGICLGAKLSAAGIPYIIIEKANRVGGTWNENVYPGSGCDIVSHLYSYSFAQKPDWTRRFARQDEIQRYLDECARRFGVSERIRFGAAVKSARFNDADKTWTIETSDGKRLRSKSVVTAVGQLNKPLLPNLPGADQFHGPTFHSAQWDTSVDLVGKHVAVIGSGASAIQFVPEIAPLVSKLTLFQRSPNWVIPKPDRGVGHLESSLYRLFPPLLKLLRLWDYWTAERSYAAFVQGSAYGRYWEDLSRQALEAAIQDPELRRILTPDYPAGCKRILLSNEWFKTLARANVEVVPRQASGFNRTDVIDSSGEGRPVDVVIYATGFQANEFLPGIQVHGRDGRDLSEFWKERPKAHRGVTLPGFPNFFMLYGPNTNLGHGSILFMLETQADYVVSCLKLMRSKGLATMEPLTSSMARYNETLHAEMGKTVWVAGCSSWYKAPDGTILNNWSGNTVEYWWQMRRPRLAEYDVVPS